MRLGRMVTFLKANKTFKLSIILVQLLFILILVIHWIACLWLVTVNTKKTWLPPKDVDWDKTEIYASSIDNVYNIFFYYSILCLVSNELMPTTIAEVWVSTIILVIGCLTIGSLIGEFSSIMNDMSERTQKINEDFDMIQSVMASLKLPEEIQQQVISYYETVQMSKFIHNEQVYEYLNRCITDSVKLFQIEEIIEMSGLLSYNQRNHVVQLSSLFQIQFYQQNEFVIKQNDLPDYFYLICEGIVEVFQEKNDFVYFEYEKKKSMIDNLTNTSNQHKRQTEQKAKQKRLILDPSTIRNFRDKLTLDRLSTVENNPT